MQYIQVFDSYVEQLEALKNINKRYPLTLLINRQTIDMNFNYDGTENYSYRYADKDKNILPQYLPLDKNYINKNFYVVPNDVEYINVYNIYNHDLQESIPIQDLYKNNKEPLYKIGLMSDIHYNDTDESDQDPTTIGNDDGSEYSEDLQNALHTFIDEGVDFVSCSGDISTDWSAHLKNYKLCVDTYAPNLSIFTCSGNHDTKPKYKYHELWKSVSAINPNNEYEIIYFKDYEQYRDNDDYYHTEESGEGTSFYFKKYFGEDKFDVYIYLNVEYGWNNPDNYNTHDCRMLNEDELLVNQSVDYSNDYHLYHPQTLRCLEEILEEYKDHRCFIFTHLMLMDKAGNYHQENNYMTNSDNYYPYAETHIDILRGDQGKFIQQLMEKYSNNLWFCGHSHYKWNWEKLDHDINITKSNKSYNVHLPSLSRPLPYGIKSYQTAQNDSEAAIMEVYDNYVIIKGMVMKEKDFDNSSSTFTIEQFPEDQCEQINANMFSYNSENPYVHVTDLDNNEVQLDVQIYSTGNNDDNNIYLNTGIIDSSNYTNYTPVLRFDYVQIWHDNLFDNLDPNSETYESDKSILISEFTNEVLSECKIGFRDNTTNPDEWNYYFESNHIYTLYPQGLVFKISSSSAYKNLSLHIKMKGALGFIHENYINQYLPIAIFKLNTNQ